MRIPQSSGLLFAVLLQPFAAGAADVFVACQTGNDLSTGATPATALRTIQTAVSRAAGGDTVRVLAGVCDASNQPPFPVLMKDGVSVVGAGQSATFVVGVNGNPLFRFADLGAV